MRQTKKKGKSLRLKVGDLESLRRRGVYIGIIEHNEPKIQ
jgi:hypothetical protein